jgi:uncharacterized membrane protein
MRLRRPAKHLMTTPWAVRRAFPRRTLEAIEAAIHRSRGQHVGEIRFVVEGALHGPRLYRGETARERAIEVFSMLRMWDTDQRNGVLIYLLLADRAVEIVADRGVHAAVGTAEWERICREMQAEFKAGRYERGAVSGIEMVTRHLAAHYPAQEGGPSPGGGSRGDRDELPDSPVVLP